MTKLIDEDSKIREIIESIKESASKGELQCNFNFRCENNDFSKLGKVEDRGWPNHLECFEKYPSCGMSVPFGDTNMCRCPLRIYIYRKYKI